MQYATGSTAPNNVVPRSVMRLHDTFCSNASNQNAPHTHTHTHTIARVPASVVWSCLSTLYTNSAIQNQSHSCIYMHAHTCESHAHAVAPYARSISSSVRLTSRAVASVFKLASSMLLRYTRDMSRTTKSAHTRTRTHLQIETHHRSVDGERTRNARQ
jgi:hypothetical protein